MSPESGSSLCQEVSRNVCHHVFPVFLSCVCELVCMFSFFCRISRRKILGEVYKFVSKTHTGSDKVIDS